METLSVGMYVRFDGIIRQIIDIDFLLNKMQELEKGCDSHV